MYGKHKEMNTMLTLKQLSQQTHQTYITHYSDCNLLFVINSASGLGPSKPHAGISNCALLTTEALLLDCPPLRLHQPNYSKWLMSHFTHDMHPPPSKKVPFLQSDMLYCVGTSQPTQGSYDLWPVIPPRRIERHQADALHNLEWTTSEPGNFHC